eukprot:Platyproteum_vivax@DN6882_c0_g1_i2.p1
MKYFLVVLAFCLVHAIQDVDNDGNYCYADNDNYDIATKSPIDNENTQRADYVKCIPPRTGVNSFYRKQIYAILKRLHQYMCVHVDMSFSSALNQKLNNLHMSRPPFYCNPNISYQTTHGMNCYNYLKNDFVAHFAKTVKRSMNIFEVKVVKDHPHLKTECADNKYALYNFAFDLVDDRVTLQTISFEHESPLEKHYDLNANEYCGQVDGAEEGGACVFTMSSLDTLPANQQNGFSNSEFTETAKQANIYRASIDKTIPADEDQIYIFKGQMSHYIHCHYTPSNTGYGRLGMQHVHERRYPTASHNRKCFCDWRNLGKMVTRCDCTKDGSANNNCGAAEAALLQTVGVACNNCNN